MQMQKRLGAHRTHKILRKLQHRIELAQPGRPVQREPKQLSYILALQTILEYMYPTTVSIWSKHFDLYFHINQKYSSAGRVNTVIKKSFLLLTTTFQDIRLKFGHKKQHSHTKNVVRTSACTR